MKIKNKERKAYFTFVILIVILIVNFTALLSYVYYSRYFVELSNGQDRFVEFIDAANAAQQVPNELKPALFSALNSKNLSENVSNKPLYPMVFRGNKQNIELAYLRSNGDLTKFKPVTYNDLKELFLHFKGFKGEGSFDIGGGLWLNVSYYQYYSFYFFVLFILFIAELVALVMMFIYLRILDRFEKPLRGLTQNIESFDLTDFRALGKSLSLAGVPSSLHEVTDAIDRMQQRIVDITNERNLIFAALSHDLRTPLTRMKLRVQLLEDDNQKEKMEKNIDEMETLIEDMLRFSRLSDKASNDKIDGAHKFDLISLLDSITYELKDLGYPVEAQSNVHRLPFLGRSKILRRAFNNVLGNAVKYGESAKVTVDARQDKVIITVDDQGPGIPLHELEKAFIPFYRGENVRQQKSGAGLGLSIVKLAVTAHDGSVVLQNRPEGGLRVLIELPFN